jgi:hypothetical protein
MGEPIKLVDTASAALVPSAMRREDDTVLRELTLVA